VELQSFQLLEKNLKFFNVLFLLPMAGVLAWGTWTCEIKS